MSSCRYEMCPERQTGTQEVAGPGSHTGVSLSNTLDANSKIKAEQVRNSLNMEQLKTPEGLVCRAVAVQGAGPQLKSDWLTAGECE